MRGVLYPEQEILNEAYKILETGSTYRASREMGRAQSTIWYHMAYQLNKIDQSLYLTIRVVLRNNDRRGGR